MLFRIAGKAVNRPGFPGGLGYESRRPLPFVEQSLVALLGFGRRDVADGLQQPEVVEPVDPGQRRELDGVEGSPGPPPMDDLGLVWAVGRLGEGVVEAVALAADRRLDAGFRQALVIADAYVLGG